MILICNDCHRVHESRSLKSDSEGRFFCSKPGCNQELIELDELMVPTISVLWDKGYSTIGCCSGHHEGSACNVPYIIFERYPEDLILVPPEDYIAREVDNSTKIILEPVAVGIPDMHLLLERNNRLLRWAEALHSII